jgi:hypothetical protein
MARQDDEPFVRPFGLTGGRTEPSRADLDLTTQVTAVDDIGPPVHRGRLVMAPETQAIVHLASRPIAIAELAARLALPLTTVRILVGDLVDDGHLTIRPGLQDGEIHGRARLAFLQRVRDGLINA